MSFDRQCEAESFPKLIQQFAEHGETATPAGGLFELFKLPVDGDTVTVKALTSTPTSGAIEKGERRITVREREGDPDVILMLSYPDRAYAFLTDEYGKLLKATMLNPEPHRMEGPERRFGEERLFWLMWTTEIDGANTGQAD